MSRNMKEMVGGCCVCSEELGWSENPLVYCDGQGCNVAVHQACYGIVQVPIGPWFCKKCESQERIVRVKCELCPQRDGALKRTNSGGWCHVVCALYIPEAWFANVQTMEPIVLVSVPQERFNKTCYICEEQKRDTKATAGACMQCNRNGCKQYFHVTCAQAQGLLCEVTGSYENVKYCGYCSHHYKKLKHLSNVKTIPAFRPIPNDNETPDSSPEKNPPAITIKEEDEKPQKLMTDPPIVPAERDVKSPQVDQSVSSTSDSIPPTLVANHKADSTIPSSSSSSSSTLRRQLSQVSDISSAASPLGEEMKSPGGSEQGQEPSSSSVGVAVAVPKSQTPPLTPILQDGSATSSTENLFEMNMAAGPPCLEKEPVPKKTGKKLPLEINTSDNGPKRQRFGSMSRSADKPGGGKGGPRKPKPSVTSSSTVASSTNTRGKDGVKKERVKRTRHQSGSGSKASQNAAASSSVTSNSQAGLPGHHDYCGSVFGGSPYFQSLSAPGHVNLPAFSSSSSSPSPSPAAFFSSMSNASFHRLYGIDYHHPYDPSAVKSNHPCNLQPPPKVFPNPFQDSGTKYNFPLTMEQLLEQQWDHGAHFLMEQGDHFDISSLLNSLHRLKSENQQLCDQIEDLTSRRNHLMAVNARLSVPLSLLDSSPLMARTSSSWGSSLEDISSPDDGGQSPTFGVPMADKLVVEDIVSPAENPPPCLTDRHGNESSGTNSTFAFSESQVVCGGSGGPSQPLMYSVVNPPPPPQPTSLTGGGGGPSSLPPSVSSLLSSINPSSSSSSPSMPSSLSSSSPSVFKSFTSSSINPSLGLLEPSVNGLPLAASHHHLRPNTGGSTVAMGDDT